MIRSTMRMIPASSSTNGTRSSRPARSTKQLPDPLTITSVTDGIGEQRLERPEPGDLVGELPHQPLVPLRGAAAGRPRAAGRRGAAAARAPARRRAAPPPPSRSRRRCTVRRSAPSASWPAIRVTLTPLRPSGPTTGRRLAARSPPGRPSTSGSRWASTPASTARATASRAGTRAITGRPRTSAISFAPIARPGSSTTTMPGRPTERRVPDRAPQREVAAPYDDDRRVRHLQQRPGRRCVCRAGVDERRHRAVPQRDRERGAGFGGRARGERAELVAPWDQRDSGRGLDREPVQRVGGCARPGIEPVRHAGVRLGAQPEDRGLVTAEIHQSDARTSGEHERARRREHGRAGATLG